MKIYVEILTPCNGKKYEIAMDDKSAVGKVKEQIKKEIIKFESEETFSLGNDLLLYSPEKKACISDYENVRSAGIKSGQKLFLI